MTRRKIVCGKGTIVLFLIVFTPYVLTRPHDEQSVDNSQTETSQNIRYRFKNNIDTFSPNLPIVITYLNGTTANSFNATESVTSELIKVDREGRVVKKRKPNTKNNAKRKVNSKNKIDNDKEGKPARKSTIRKVITKWNDETKYEALEFPPESITNDKLYDKVHFTHFNDGSTKSDDNNAKRYPYGQTHSTYYRPIPEYSEETQVYSNNVHILDYPYNRPSYIHTTPPSPTPIITNVGYPKPWPQIPQVTRKTTRKPAPVTEPVKDYNYHNIVHNNYPNFEVTTFEPSNAYTEKIVIRPDEYNASPDECPTIFLTLNNTFQGQAKEACPDLNIAVNTNVINKNVVIDSDEEDDSDSILPALGIPLDDDSLNDDSSTGDYFQSEEQVQGDSASVEGTALANYNTANSAVQSQLSEPISLGSPTSPLSALSKPGRPNKDDDDLFGFSSLLTFFRPAVSALGWLTSLNPILFGLFPLLLTPIAFFFAGSGVASFFSTWFLPYGREAPKVVHLYKPELYWHDRMEKWQSHEFPTNRRVGSRLRNGEVENREGGKVNMISRMKQWMRLATEKIRELDKNQELSSNHKSKRKNSRSTSYKAADITSEDSSTAVPNAPKVLKSKEPIGDALQELASQLLEKTENTSEQVIAESRVSTKLKFPNQKHKTIQNEDDALYNGHAGEAVPITIEDLETENASDVINDSATTKEGISTWVLVSSPTNVSSVSTEPTKTDEVKKSKPTGNKNKKRPSNKNQAKRPIIASSNKADLIAAGSAINENVYNKIKDTVLTNVQKNKNANSQRTTTTTTTPVPTETPTTTKETTKAPVTKTKNKNKNKQKTTTTEAPSYDDSALLPMEAKESEIEVEISTPPTTTKKPKRNTTRKKNKKRKPSASKPTDATGVSDIKANNKTKTSKPTKKPETGAITTQLYNYFSREVMPSVGVGMIGLASLVGIASYFFYPFSTPVRRTFEVDKKDDLYKYNAEEYANDGNGQPEEEMLGTVLAGMPSHSKYKLNPYAGQTAQVNRYPVKKEQDLRHRHVAAYDPTNNRFPQQKTGIAHGAVYPKPVNYGVQYETRHVYTTEGKYNYEKAQSYTPYPAVEPIYAAPQTGSGVSGYGGDTPSAVVYGIKPGDESDFKPVYPFDGQFYGESTSSPATYAPTSMYLGSNSETQDDNADDLSGNESDESKFVVGNVPKELMDTATPAVVREHGPRKLKKRSISTSLEEILRAEKDNNIFISNEIDDTYNPPIRNLASLDTNEIGKPNEVIPIYPLSEPIKEDNNKQMIIESVSTIPVDKESTTTESNTSEFTTKAFKVYEVFTTDNPESPKVDITTESKVIVTETVTDRPDTSTVPSSSSSVSVDTSSMRPKPTDSPDVITYPPLNQGGGFFSFLRRLVDFKYRLGLSILQNTSESLNRYLRSMEDTMEKVAKASNK
ncbi:uncharacterized protein LOC101738605 [Bombyx mori]|uniref:uncharacterized protein LOC101738605 n=1 Tax=Bombyx mori TaxID=7091 RepID=UPI002ED05E5F